MGLARVILFLLEFESIIAVKYFSLGDLKGLPEHDPDYVQRMATPLFIFSKSNEGLATWTIWGVPTPPRSTNPLYIYRYVDMYNIHMHVYII